MQGLSWNLRHDGGLLGWSAAVESNATPSAVGGAAVIEGVRCYEACNAVNGELGVVRWRTGWTAITEYPTAGSRRAPYFRHGCWNTPRSAQQH